MMGVRGKLRTVEAGQLGFWCLGCEEIHVVNSGWQFNGDYDRPTFTPSVLVLSGHYSSNFNGHCWCTYKKEHPEEKIGFSCSICHLFITDGKIQYLSDCSHALAGQTVEMVVPG